jgi:hypothetical protein
VTDFIGGCDCVYLRERSSGKVHLISLSEENRV